MIMSSEAAFVFCWRPDVGSAVEPLTQREGIELEELYGKALEVLDGLDRLGLFKAGAHLAMALEAMRQRNPNLSAPH